MLDLNVQPPVTEAISRFAGGDIYSPEKVSFCIFILAFNLLLIDQFKILRVYSSATSRQSFLLRLYISSLYIQTLDAMPSRFSSKVRYAAVTAMQTD